MITNDAATQVPFTIAKAELSQFIGRATRPLVTECGPAVHIIIERSTGKTMDCFIEFASTADAHATLAWINGTFENGQPTRLGNRYVQAEMSSQSELMRAMFPRAKCVRWEGGVPVVVPRSEGEIWSTGFTGFLTEEELFSTIRHAESPLRSPFISRCPRRPYEFMISTLQKYCLHLAAGNYDIISSAQLSTRFWPFDTLIRKVDAQEPLVLRRPFINSYHLNGGPITTGSTRNQKRTATRM
ncbi:hypothetical protein KEM52_004898 [Ascosphaera acerosa]|nr:hypothetical protein KEM52_004898 [Ascosphaera acerosa]